MCGINGFLGENQQKICAMNHAIKHRGPDADGFFIHQDFSLGHVRLSILDTTSAANQPMHSLDGRFTIVFNGEIYNFKELKRELGLHYQFKTQSDTEVLLAGFQEWGTDMFRKLNGIFAFAILDTKEDAVYLVRDRSGIKPLFYYFNQDEDHFVFSSEMSAFFVYGIEPRLNIGMFDAYIRLLFTPGEETMCQGIKRLEPGTYMRYDKKKGILEKHTYVLSRKDNKKIRSWKQAKKEVEQTVRDAVERQLISDRPLGIYLSGGFDSSIILDAVAKIKKEKNDEVPIDTLSIGFDLDETEGRKKFNRDCDLAQETARFYGTRHTRFLIRKNEVISALKRAITHLGEPIANPTIVPMILLAERVKKQGIDVVLGGDGGDELFGGYERYLWAKRRDWYRRALPSICRGVLSTLFPKLQKLNDQQAIDCYGRFMFQKEHVLQEVMGVAYRDGSVFKKKFTEQYLGSSSVNVTKTMDVDRRTWLTNESLIRSDTLAMAHGIEARVPLLDNAVLLLATRIPIYFKVGFFDTKKVLKHAFKKTLPNYLFHQPKRGWYSPGAKWLRDPDIQMFVKTVLQRGFHDETDHLFDWEKVNNMLEEHIIGKRYNAVMLWAIILFRLWAKEINVKRDMSA